MAPKKSKLICKLYPNQLDERAITLDVGDKRDKQDNMNLALLTGKGIGLCLNSVKIEDLMEDQEEAFLRLIWQIFKGYYLNNVKKNKAQLELIKEGDEEKPGLLLPETIITRWVNVHLEKAGVSKRLKNFPQDLKVNIL